MRNEDCQPTPKQAFSRRHFLAVGGAAAAAGAIPLRAQDAGEGEKAKAKIVAYRTLGRTGFKVSDIAMGGAASDANVIRYAYDHGINYFDTAESYGNGENERKIGEALAHMDRAKVFISTKVAVDKDTTADQIIESFGKCLERLRSDHADALLMPAVSDVSMVAHAGFHAAIKKLKSDGRVKHAGIASHGPRGEGDSMEKVLCAAAEDGRFDLMLLVYNFMNSDQGENVLACCKKHNIGTTAMKTAPGAEEPDPFDPENPSKDYADFIARMTERGMSRDDAVARIQGWIKEQQELRDKAKPFMEKHGITTSKDLHRKAVQWVLQNPDMHTVCMGFRDFDSIDTFVPLSGTKLAYADACFLEDYRLAYSSTYCRHACTSCSHACPHGVPVNTIMRYSYYFTLHGREKLAMQKYHDLAGRDASPCLSCSGLCQGACPHAINIQASLVRAHSRLSIA